MESISDIKLNLINLIAGISDSKKLQTLYALAKFELTDTKPENKVVKNVFEAGKIEIRSGVSKEQIFKEQGNRSISFSEVKEIMTDETWEQSLEELLATLN